MPESVSDVMVRVAVPVFFRVEVRAAAVVPTEVLAKESDVGERLTAGAGGAAPVPERATVCGEPVALSATLTEAVRLPVAVGLKVTVMVQVALTASVTPQLLVWL